MEKKPFELRILGPTELRGTVESGKDGPPPPKRLALLAYLCLETADGFRRRDQIVGLLWPELPQDAARTQLRKALSSLRETFGAEAILTRGETEVRIDSSTVWCDAVALTNHARSGEWTEALDLFRGELLEGFFVEGVGQEWEEWLEDQRRSIRREAARAAWECSRLEEHNRDWKSAAVMARRALDLTPDDENGVRRLMSILDHGGDRGGALRVYDEWRKRLDSEYGVEPAPETRKLARKVQAARKGESHETPPLEVASLTEPGAVGSGSRVPSRPRWRSRVLIGATMLIVVVVTAAYAVRGAWSQASPMPHSLALLPIRAIGSGMESPAAAIDEELNTAFIGERGLTIRPVSRSIAFDHCKDDLECIGRRSHTAFILVGGMQENEGQLRITMRLIRTSNETAVWAGGYDVPLADGNVGLQRVVSSVVSASRPLVLNSR